ncbi:MAG: S41 family peptidase [Armatimonadota bacterium]
MRQREPIWWVGATVAVLAGFSFFSGLGIRGLYAQVASGREDVSNLPKLASTAPRVPDPDLRPAELYWDVLHKLQLYYVEPLPPKSKLAYGAIDTMLNQLKDPNTRLLSPEEMSALKGVGEGRFTGLGAVLTVRRYNNRPDAAMPVDEEGGNADEASRGVRTITVVSVPPGTPADKAGLQPGDRITEIDGKWVAPIHLSYRVLTQLTDPAGPQDGQPDSPHEDPERPEPDPKREQLRKEAEEEAKRWKTATDLASGMTLLASTAGEHELTVERGTPAKTVKVRVNLADTQVPLVSARKLNGANGYLQVLAFDAATVKKAGEELAALKKQGVKHLVLDLRQNAGGSLEATRDLAGMLMGDGKFATVKEYVTQADGSRKLTDRPLVIKGVTPVLKPASLSVLVNGGTAGTAELLAASLRDGLSAKLVGSETFGAGTIQEVHPLPNGAGVSITRAKVLTARGIDFDAKGLKADVAPQGDPVEAAVKALSAGA